MSNKREEAADVILNSLEKTEKAPDSKHSFFFDGEKEQNSRTCSKTCSDPQYSY